MERIDTLIHARWVVPVEPDGVAHEHHAVAVRAGRIVALAPSAEAEARYQAGDVVRLDSHVLIPGLVNAHTHAAMSLFRGLADDLPLMDWLQRHVWPAEARWVNPEFVRDGTELAIAEMLKSGTTCFSDMYFYPEDTARACLAAGMRAVVGLILIDFPTAYAQTPDEYLKKAVALHDDLRASELVATAFAPHAPYTVSDAPLGRLRTLNDELNLPLHTHVHETAHEVAEALRTTGRRPLARLAELGLAQPNLVAVHMTQLEDEEIARVAECGAHVVHCPESNLKLASGFCPVHKLLQAGVNVALGTDGAASNNDLDLLGEMRTAALLAKGVAGDATALPAHTALRMATLNGARAFGLDDRIGSIVPGKSADLAALDLSAVATQPVYDPVSHLVYAAGREQVTDVWIHGKRVLARRALTTLDEDAVLARARAWRERIGRFDAEAVGKAG
jgi:5-methylthioadenosine/S-adenosylhomocysteine deaminase